MANLADGTTWDEDAPAAGDPRKDGQVEIRGLRKGVRLRSEREHETYASSSAGGEHKQGSAKAYLQSSSQSSAPTLRPDGTTALDSDDDGRVWVDSDDYAVYVYEHPSWVQASGTQVATGNFTGAALTAGEQTCAAGFAADVVHLVTDDGFAWTIPLKADADPSGTGGVYESTAVNTVRIRIRRSGTDVLISLVGSTLTLSGTFQWMAIKFS